MLCLRSGHHSAAGQVKTFFFILIFPSIILSSSHFLILAANIKALASQNQVLCIAPYKMQLHRNIDYDVRAMFETNFPLSSQS